MDPVDAPGATAPSVAPTLSEVTNNTSVVRKRNYKKAADERAAEKDKKQEQFMEMCRVNMLTMQQMQLATQQQAQEARKEAREQAKEARKEAQESRKEAQESRKEAQESRKEAQEKSDRMMELMFAAVSTQWANGNRMANLVCRPGQPPVIEGFLESTAVPAKDSDSDAAAAPGKEKDSDSDADSPPKRLRMSTRRKFK